MKKAIRFKKVTRVQKATAVGKVYYPRLEVSGAELADAGFEFGKEVRVEIEDGKVTFYLV
jgi:hypothetical protein